MRWSSLPKPPPASTRRAADAEAAPLIAQSNLAGEAESHDLFRPELWLTGRTAVLPPALRRLMLRALAGRPDVLPEEILSVLRHLQFETEVKGAVDVVHLDGDGNPSGKQLHVMQIDP
jgi:hypothetical protein